ncbi:MAG TPA: tetratricopeptide repeat protein [Polyangia bacterium]|jgi:tetratricopeptide (TPR) repeat protein
MVVPSAASEATQADQHARTLFNRAEINFNLGRFREAMADYQLAYQTEPLPGFVFNIAQCYRNLDDYDRASFFFRRYLALDRLSPRRAQVEALISEMEARKKTAGDPRRALPDVRQPPTAAEPQISLGAAPIGGAAGVDDRPGALRRWWFWATVGGVLAAATLTAALLLQRNEASRGLMPIDARGK